MTSRGNQEDDFRDFDFDNTEDLGGDEISFDDFDNDADMDDDLFGDGDDDGGGFDEGGDENTSANGGGPSRTFVIIAGVMVVILLLVGGLLVALATGIISTGPSEFELASTEIALTNQAVALLIEQTNAAGTEVFFITQTADAFTETPTPTATFTPTETPDVAATQTVLAAESGGTSTAVALTAAAGTPLGFDLTLTAATDIAGGGTPVGGTPSGVNPNNVLGTATALAATLQAQRTGIPTAGVGGGTAAPIPTFNPGTGGGDNLPDTGLFDDLGSGGPGMLLLMGLGLIGIIAVSRGARAANKSTG